MNQMFILYVSAPRILGLDALAVSKGIAPLWQVMLDQKNSAKDRRTLSYATTRDDFAGGEPIHLSGCVYQIARIPVV